MFRVEDAKGFMVWGFGFGVLEDSGEPVLFFGGGATP